MKGEGQIVTDLRLRLKEHVDTLKERLKDLLIYIPNVSEKDLKNGDEHKAVEDFINMYV